MNNWRRSGEKQELDRFEKGLDSLVKLLEFDGARREYVVSRWRAECLEMAKWSKRNRSLFYRLRFFAVTCSVIVPALVGFDLAGQEEVIRVAAFILSLVAALSVTLLQLFRFGEKWRLYRHSARRLLSEGWHFVDRTGPYREYNSAGDAFPFFAEAVEGILKEFEDSYQNELLIFGERAERTVSSIQ